MQAIYLSALYGDVCHAEKHPDDATKKRSQAARVLSTGERPPQYVRRNLKAARWCRYVRARSMQETSIR
jgi:hypothetical protein